MSVTLLVAAAAAATSGLALGRALIKVELPEKWVWFVGFGLLFAHTLANALYQYGGIYVVLMPVLPILSNAFMTTGTLAVAIGAYSSVHKAAISAHWYSLPTGCAPIAMLAQYVPSFYFQLAFLGLIIAYILVKAKDGKAWVMPLGLLAAASVINNVSAIPALPVLGPDELHLCLQGAAALLMAFLCTGDGLTIGKTKIL
jgi:hypothetical protein